MEQLRTKASKKDIMQGLMIVQSVHFMAIALGGRMRSRNTSLKGRGEGLLEKNRFCQQLL